MQITDAERKARRNQRIREQRERLKAENPEAYQRQCERERQSNLKNKQKTREKKKAALYCRQFDATLWAERLNRYSRRMNTLSLQEASEMLGMTQSELIIGGINGHAPRPIGVGTDGSASYDYETIKQHAEQRKDG